MSERNAIGMLLVGLLLGGLTGAVVALLFAPQSGTETRTLIRDKAQQTAEQARARTDEVVRQLKDQSQSVIQSVRRDGMKQPEGEPAV